MFGLLNRIPRLIIFALVAVIGFVADFVTKFAAENSLGPNKVASMFPLPEGVLDLPDTIEIAPGILSFTFSKNTGAAFGMFPDTTGIFVGIAIAFLFGAIIYVVATARCGFLRNVSLALMCAGAAGNAWDRFINGYVVDFIQLEFIDFPIFNLADVCLVVGCVLLIITLIITRAQNCPPQAI